MLTNDITRSDVQNKATDAHAAGASGAGGAKLQTNAFRATGPEPDDLEQREAIQAYEAEVESGMAEHETPETND